MESVIGIEEECEYQKSKQWNEKKKKKNEEREILFYQKLHLLRSLVI